MLFSNYINSDYYYINHSKKYVTFIYESEKRQKTKVINFLKKNHIESNIVKYLQEKGLKLEKYGTSKKYIHYKIVNL